MIKNKWDFNPKSKASSMMDRWVNQFMLYAKKNSYGELLTDFDSNQEIEQTVFNFLKEQRKIYTESTVSQKIAALVFFYYLHRIPFLSDRIIESFPNHPLYYIDFTIDLLNKK